MGENSCDIVIGIFIGILMIFLFVFIFTNCLWTEKFTAPGLTLTIPPSWFPQNAAEKYNPKNWMSKMYLDRYPFWVANNTTPKGKLTPEYMSEEESDILASTNRFWKM